MSGIDDIDDMLNEGSIVDLGWLSPEQDFYGDETLPKQNLNIIPDLKALWSHTDVSPYRLVPNLGSKPLTVGDLSTTHGLLRGASQEDIEKKARLLLTQNTDIQAFKKEMHRHFDGSSLNEHKTTLKRVLAERGLLGNYYLVASDFSDCHNNIENTKVFVSKFASKAAFLVRKGKCGGCNFATKVNGSEVCSVFQKKLVIEVPYSDDLADIIETARMKAGFSVQARLQDDPKLRIQRAFLAEVGDFSGADWGKPVENLDRLQTPRKQLPKPIIKRDIRPLKASLKGIVLTQLSTGVIDPSKYSSFMGAIQASDSEASLRNIYSEVVALKAASTKTYQGDGVQPQMGEVSYHEARNALVSASTLVRNKHSAFIRKAREEIATPIVKFIDVQLNKGVSSTVLATRIANAFPHDLLIATKDVWYPKFKAVPETGETLNRLRTVAPRSAFSVARDSQPKQITVNPLIRAKVATTASVLMNEGWYGQPLYAQLQTVFDAHVLSSAKEELRSVLADQGLQGRAFIDPSVYSDYGKGCKEAASKFRQNRVPYLKIGSKCGGCIYAREGSCSVINKKLVAEPPYRNKEAQQRQILAGQVVADVSRDNDGEALLEDFDVSAQELEVSFTDKTEPEYEVSFDGGWDI